MIEELRAVFDGDLLEPGDDGYDVARSLWNGQIDNRPALIARCTSAVDVAAAIDHARRTGLEIGVRGGGHGSSGAAVPDDGMMIDLSRLNQITVDPGTRRARCGGGATQAELDAATQAHGLAVTGGTISHTGVGGLTLGGGIGWLSRMCGATIDNMVSAEVVLADGRCVRACADQHPDLWWALRGGGGNFGVVTEFEFRLHPVGPIVHLGMLFWDLSRAGEALRVARDVVNGLPSDAGGMIIALNAPPAPFVPEQHRFAPGVALVVVGFGTPEAHRALIEPAGAALQPSWEFATQLPYTALQGMLDEGAPWGVHAYGKALYLDDLSDEAIDVVAHRLPGKTSPMSLLPIFSLGGVFADVGEDDTGFGGPRSARFAFNMDAAALDPQTLAADREWVRGLWDALRPFSSNTGGYVNFMAEYDADRVRTAYGSKYERLARIKSVYDPGNVFHRNANIKPA